MYVCRAFLNVNVFGYYYLNNTKIIAKIIVITTRQFGSQYVAGIWSRREPTSNYYVEGAGPLGWWLAPLPSTLEFGVRFPVSAV